MKNNVYLEAVEKIEDYNVQTTEFTFRGRGYLVKSNDSIVGCIQGFKEEDNTFYIEEMEIDERYKGKGFGTKTIPAIKEFFNVTNVTGISLSSAVSFWSKVNARFHDTCETCSYEGCLYHKDFVMPEDGDYDDDFCDDYSENHFVVSA